MMMMMMRERRMRVIMMWLPWLFGFWFMGQKINVDKIFLRSSVEMQEGVKKKSTKCV